jgi:uncharacterized protein (TIGR03066 family)
MVIVAATVAMPFAVADDEDRFDAAKFVGVWVLTKSEAGAAPEGAIVEFGKDGALLISLEIGGKTIALKGAYKVEGDKLTVSIEPPCGGKEETDTDTIRVLTNERIVLVDKDKKLTEFKRRKT